MQNSKFVQLLRQLSPKQTKSFADFVASPYHNKQEELTDCLAYCTRLLPDGGGGKMSKQAMHEEAAPGLPYDEKAVGYWLSDLVKLIEKFWIAEYLDAQPVQQYDYLLHVYRDLELEKPFRRTLKKMRKVQENAPHRDADYYHNEFLMHAHENLYFDMQKKHINDRSLELAMDTLDLNYLSLKLQYACEIYNRRTMLAADYEPQLLPEILGYLKRFPRENVPPVAIYHNILMCHQHPEDKSHFEHLKELLDRYAHLFKTKEAKDLYLAAVNHCIVRINSGNTRYVTELFDLYKKLLDTELIYEDGLISPWGFMNIVGVGVRNQAYGWTEQFIKNYRSRLAPKFRKNAYTYNMAFLHFHKNEFGEAQKLLNEVIFDDVLYSIHSRSLLLRVYYELGETEPLLSLCDAFKIYLRRNKLISGNRRDRYLNFIKFTARLSKLFDAGSSRLQSLRQRIATTKNIANKAWLLEKLTLLE